jgi:hypothetical protein
MADRLKSWNEKIEELNANADKAKAEAKIKYYRHLENLKIKQEAAEQKEFKDPESAGENKCG